MDKSWRVIAAFIGIFVAGIVTGGLLTLRVAHQFNLRRFAAENNNPQAHLLPQAQAPGQVQAQAQQFGPQLLRRLSEQLSLTKEQREKIKPIELRTTEELRRLRRDTQHSTELIIEHMQDDIGAVLTPEQKGKFEDLILKARERIKKFMKEQELQQAEMMRKRREQLAPEGAREAAPAKEK